MARSVPFTYILSSSHALFNGFFGKQAISLTRSTFLLITLVNSMSGQWSLLKGMVYTLASCG